MHEEKGLCVKSFASVNETIWNNFDENGSIIEYENSPIGK